MSLILEIEFLTGVCRAAKEPASNVPDWPPQPDRIFSALVSTWAARGELAEERAALEWLEAQPPPNVHASKFTARTAPDVFVPPNDLKSSKTVEKYIKIMPDRRLRQPRYFPVAVPDDPTMALVWEDEPEPTLFDALDMNARDISYVGHSASLVRCRFLRSDTKMCKHPPAPARRRVYKGRLKELEQAHRVNPVRPVIRPGATITPAKRPPASAQNQWLILEITRSTTPDTLAGILVCRLLRNALMSGYKDSGQENAIPEIVSGHAPDGKPTRKPHVAIVPMTFNGSQYADGRIFGFALVPPNGKALHEIPGFLEAFKEIAPYDEGEERRVLKLKGSPLREPLRLAPISVNEKQKHSLSPGPYRKKARFWASVTPIVLDRHLKKNEDTEILELIARACEHAGHPRPDRIQISKHSAIQGMPPARPLTNTPPWTRWKVPESLSSRPLTHVVIDFGEEISGPVLLGAGRFTGLGLCRGIRMKNQT